MRGKFWNPIAGQQIAWVVSGRIRHINKDMELLTSSLRPEGHGDRRRKADVRILQVSYAPQAGNAGRTELLLFERKEEIERDKTGRAIQSAKISLFYWDLGKNAASGGVPDGEFNAYFDKGFNTVSITASCLSTGGYVVIDPPRLRGGRLGTYLMNEIVVWAKQWPDAQVREINLRRGDGENLENRLRRNRFYERFGIEFDYKDSDKAVGVSRQMQAGQLRAVETWTESIAAHSALQYIRKIAADSREAVVDARLLARQAKDLSRRISFAEQHPVRWLFVKIFIGDPVKALFAAGVALVIGAALYRF